jgi:hypothetical protein
VKTIKKFVLKNGMYSEIRYNRAGSGFNWIHQKPDLAGYRSKPSKTKIQADLKRIGSKPELPKPDLKGFEKNQQNLGAHPSSPLDFDGLFWVYSKPGGGWI